MAFDGIVIANLVHDIKTKLEGGKIRVFDTSFL